MSVNGKLDDPWEVGETVLFSFTMNDLPDGADPTDYSMKFLIERDGTLLDTIAATPLNSSSVAAIEHTLGEDVTNGDIEIFIYLVWDTTKFNRVGSITKYIEASHYV